MTTPPGPPTSGSVEKPTVYRGSGALLGGAIVFLFCVGGALDLIIEEGTADLPGASIMLLVASLAFAYGVFPAAFSHSDALVVRNPLRTIRMPWSIVTKLTAQLSFIAFTPSQRYTVWAIPVSLRDRRKAERARLRELARQSRGRGDQDRQRFGGLGGGFGGGFGGSRPSTPGQEIDRMSYADQAIMEMGARREAWCHANGVDPEVESTSTEPPTVSWNPVTIAPIAACVVFVIVAFVVH